MKNLLVLVGVVSVMACGPKGNCKRGCNQDDGENTSLELTKLADFSETRASDICAVRVDAETQETLIWLQKSQAGKDASTMALLRWRGETNLAKSQASDFGQKVLGLSDVGFGQGLKIEGTYIDDTQIDTSITKFNLATLEKSGQLDLTAGKTNEDIYDSSGRHVGELARDEQKNRVFSWQRGCKNLAQVRFSAKAEIFALMYSDSSIKLLKFSSQGKLLWKRVLVPVVRNYDEVDKTLFLSMHKDGGVAFAFSLNNKQYSAFEKSHNIALNPDLLSKRSLSLVGRLDSNNSELKFQFLEPSIDAMTWLSSSVLAVTTHVYKGFRNQPSLALVNFEKGQETLVYLPLEMSEASATVQELSALSSHEVLIVGTADYEQANTWSIVKPGKAFAGLFDIQKNAFVFTKKWGESRDNRVTALAQVGTKEFMIGVREDGWVTHDLGERRSSKSVLYRLAVTNGD